MSIEEKKQVNFNSFLAIIAIGVMGWIGTTVQSLSVKVAVIEAKMSALESAVKVIHTDTKP